MSRNRNIFTSKKALVNFALVTGITISILVQLAISMSRFTDLVEPFDIAKAEENEYLNTEIAVDVTTWNQYNYNPVRFQESISQWRNQHPMQYHVTIVLSQPSSPYVSLQLFVLAVHDALSSPHAQVVVYLHRHSNPSVLQIIATELERFQRSNQFILLTSSDGLSARLDNATATYGVQDDFLTAYMLDLSYQSKSDFTIVWRCCGLSLSNLTFDGHKDFVTVALDHYLATEKEWKESVNITDRICWALLSDKSDSPSKYDVILLNTSEHASRMSVTLRSSLPYNFFKYSDILKKYCNHFIWSGTIIPGKALFFPDSTSDNVVWNNSTEAKHSGSRVDQEDPRRPYDTIYSIESEKGIIDPRDFGVPDWIDPTILLGPRVAHSPSFQMAFAASAMIRSNVGTQYLEKFLKELLHIVETEFHQDGSDGMYRKPSRTAIIVLLVSGVSLEEMASLRALLETRYADAIERGILKLVDAPLELKQKSLRNTRSTYRDDPPEQRAWRAQQNLDLGALLEATVGLSAFVMLLEDDVEFHRRDFGNHLKRVMEQSASSPPLWARADFGFGYAGVLLRGMDIPVYQQMHTTFFDERPCDVLAIHDLVRSGYYLNVGEYLSHLGRFSSLAGKIQNIFINA
jgi:N-Acetylglucosaminyltransferase-IV (GnT-IV) conserved region